ncbi:MAG TPA: hypothetical protein VMN36_09155 [Verrucomicrobiales bacterium]|nr:hypothetical protein [Verrucomicrobiales bacterium]
MVRRLTALLLLFVLLPGAALHGVGSVGFCLRSGRLLLGPSTCLPAEGAMRPACCPLPCGSSDSALAAPGAFNPALASFLKERCCITLESTPTPPAILPEGSQTTSSPLLGISESSLIGGPVPGSRTFPALPRPPPHRPGSAPPLYLLHRSLLT